MPVRAVAPPSRASVAVLPFLNLSADPENEFFADGITEDVIAHLSKIRSIKVISRTSVMKFKKRDQSLREIGEQLGAATVLEGSVRRAGNRVRIVAQLIDRDSDEHLWAETYDRDLTDIFAIQTDVALQIASALRAELSVDERRRIRRQPTNDIHAYELYLHGRHQLIQYTAESYRGKRRGSSSGPLPRIPASPWRTPTWRSRTPSWDPKRSVRSCPWRPTRAPARPRRKRSRSTTSSAKRTARWD